jgi:hypothetical protein
VLITKIEGGTMKRLRISRAMLVIASLAIAAVASSAVAVASTRDNSHPRLMPTKLVGAPELSAVLYNAPTKTFIQFQADRGKVTAVSGNTVTVQQHQGTFVWRTQTFTIPNTADVFVNGHFVWSGDKMTAATGATSVPANATPLFRVKVGMHVRIVQTGPVGGPLQIVRLDANTIDRDLPLPTTAG